MASKKYSFLAGVFCLMASYGFSQTTTTGSGYDASDSSIIPSRSMPQHTEFMNGTYNFPAKPRNQWEVGVKAGLFTISGDVTSLPSYGVGAHIRKAFGYLFSARLNYMQGIGKGLNYNRSFNYHNNIAYADRYREGVDPVFYNYRTTMHDLSLEGILTLNNIRFHKAKTGFNIYALGGFGGMIYKAKVNAVNDQDNAANIFGPNYASAFAGVQGGVYKDRKTTKDDLKEILDDTYETEAETHGNRRPTLRGNTFRPVAHIGAGVQFKINNRINLALEDRFSIAKDDLLDGQRWAEQVNGQPVLTRDYDTYNHLSLGLNFNLGAKGTEPLWWMNPLDYAYSEIRNPRLMRLPKPVLPDTDGDGITDQFDQEQTPAGVPVDSHGVSRDTDGDGVPDARDKELITPTNCQPVDADGVGKCPCPEGCAAAVDSSAAGACAASLGALPSVTFSGNTSVALSADARSMLASVAAR
ncbi:MAG: hypothetical protein WKF70_02245, partial [Chitinophagaceae bacterium]